MTEIHEIQPREQKGRDTLARFRAQLMAAAYASLQILDGKGADRVYSDYHDDFVVRHNENGKRSYHFFQVKTNEKRKYQWSLNDTWGDQEAKETQRPRGRGFAKDSQQLFWKAATPLHKFRGRLQKINSSY
jgi:hypothetical protein